MNQFTTEPNDVFVLAAAETRSPEIPEEHDVYGWLVGSWDLDVLHYRAQNISSQRIKAEAHFAWALEGRAIQDVWIMPRVSGRNGNLDSKMNMYGTTLRVWDVSLKAWRITWINPAGQHFEQQVGRRVGQEIVQLGVRGRWHGDALALYRNHGRIFSLAW